MKNLILILFLIVFTVGCAKLQFTYTAPPEIVPYVESFIAAADARGVNLINVNLEIVFGSIYNPDFVGLCEYYANRITIVRSKWDEYDVNYKTILIWHELGHCVLKRDHVDLDIEHNGNIYPASLMFYAVIPKDAWLQLSEYYTNELFNVSD